MSSKIAFVRARIEPQLKQDVDAIFDELGITTTQAITMLYRQVKQQRTLPFELHIPNKTTAKAIKEARQGKGVTACKDADDLFEQLGI